MSIFIMMLESFLQQCQTTADISEETSKETAVRDVSCSTQRSEGGGLPYTDLARKKG